VEEKVFSQGWWRFRNLATKFLGYPDAVRVALPCEMVVCEKQSSAKATGVFA
jgi:hypothetical protein